MIVIGYQGIGKTSLAYELCARYIDLESSLWKIDGVRADNWYETYCNVAEALAFRHIVFTSSHDVVRARLKRSKQKVFVCYPALELRDEWVERLEHRYYSTRSAKDYAAWKNAEEKYEENIIDLARSGFPRIVIRDLSYDLHDLIQEAVRKEYDNVSRS